MTNQLETAKEWLSDLNKIIDKTDNECTKQKRDVLEWLVESVERLENKNKNLNKEIGMYSSKLDFYAQAAESLGSELRSLTKNMVVPKHF